LEQNLSAKIKMICTGQQGKSDGKSFLGFPQNFQLQPTYLIPALVIQILQA
jgi:hypothetical protein